MKTVVNHVVTYPNRYTVTNIDSNTIDLTPDFGPVLQAGTKLDAEFFNGIKNDITTLDNKLKSINPDTTDIDLSILETQIQMQKSLGANKTSGKYVAYSMKTNASIQVVYGQLNIAEGYVETV